MLKDILTKHVGYVVAINATNPEKLESCGLKEAGDDCFSVVTQKGLLIHIPYSRILSVVENNEGGPLKVGGMFSSAKTLAVIHIEHMVIYKGAIGFGFQIPV